MSGNQEKLTIEYVGTLFGHNGWVTALTVGKDVEGKPLLVSGSRDRKLIVWKLHLDKPEKVTDEKRSEESIVGKPLKSMSGHSHFVSGIAISKDSKFLVSSSWDKTLRIWDLNTFKTRQLITGHSKDVLSVSFSNEGRTILSGGMDKSLKVWNTKGENKFTDNFGGWVSCITHIRQEKQQLLAVGSWDAKVRIYDKDFQLLNTIEGFDYGVVSTAVDEEGDFLFSAEKNGKIRVHSLNGHEAEQKSYIDVNGDINAISFESRYFMAISVATSKGLLIHEVNKQNKVIYEKNMNAGACHSLAWDETKTYLFAGFSDGAIRVFKFNTDSGN